MDPYYKARKQMVEEQLRRRGIKDERVLDVMLKVPRHLFVDESLRSRAYGDYPLPIGEDQTISQPYIVALMTEALQLKGDEKVLEIGTGSGYQTAILAELCSYVFSIERFQSLADKAMKLLENLGYTNIKIKVGDGTLGWPEKAPFNGIIVTAGSPDIPKPLIEQLKMEGIIVIPVGGKFSQTLYAAKKTPKGLEYRDLGDVRFVRLIGLYGWEE